METTKFLLKNQLAVHTLGYEGSPEGGDLLVLAMAGGDAGDGATPNWSPSGTNPPHQLPVQQRAASLNRSPGR